jgi:hypothetical protein
MAPAPTLEHLTPRRNPGQMAAVARHDDAVLVARQEDLRTPGRAPGRRCARRWRPRCARQPAPVQACRPLATPRVARRSDPIVRWHDRRDGPPGGSVRHLVPTPRRVAMAPSPRRPRSGRRIDQILSTETGASPLAGCRHRSSLPATWRACRPSRPRSAGSRPSPVRDPPACGGSVRGIRRKAQDVLRERHERLLNDVGGRSPGVRVPAPRLDGSGGGAISACWTIAAATRPPRVPQCDRIERPGSPGSRVGPWPPSHVSRARGWACRARGV